MSKIVTDQYDLYLLVMLVDKTESQVLINPSLVK